MGKEFALEPLIHAQAIITDENDVGIFVDKCANIKAIITSDTVQINRKYKTSIPFKPHVVMVQCINEMPRIKDKSDSFSDDRYSFHSINVSLEKNANTSKMII